MPRFIMRDYLTKELGYSISDEAYDIFLELAETFMQFSKKEFSKTFYPLESRVDNPLLKKIAQLKIDLVYALHAQTDDPRATELKIDEILKEFYSYV